MSTSTTTPTLTPGLSTSHCHCRAMTLTFPTPHEKLNECHCTLCRRYGALWGYYRPQDVKIEGPKTHVYSKFHRCATCGQLTHWLDPDENPDEMGVNCNMLEKEELATLERFVDEDGEGPEYPRNKGLDERE